MQQVTLQCLMADCSAPPAGRGLCPKHYAYVRQHGLVDQYPKVGRAVKPAMATICDIPECDARGYARGMCRIHYHAWWRRNRGSSALRPIRQSGGAALRDENGQRLCGTCGRWLNIDKFSTSSSTSDGLHITCNDCKRARRYGLTYAELIEILERQEFRCKVCATDLYGSAWHVDHDHACCPGVLCCGKCIRGLLCIACNVGIGKFGDTLAGVMRVVRYLENWEKEKAR